MKKEIKLPLTRSLSWSLDSFFLSAATVAITAAGGGASLTGIVATWMLVRAPVYSCFDFLSISRIYINKYILFDYYLGFYHFILIFIFFFIITLVYHKIYKKKLQSKENLEAENNWLNNWLRILNIILLVLDLKIYIILMKAHSN